MDERKSTITIGGKEYDLILTTRATKEISKRFSGFDNLGDKLAKSDNFEGQITDVVWLITLLANQSIMIYNIQHPDDKKELLTEEMVEILTVPYELASYNEAITEALNRGTNRNIKSEEEESGSKN